MIIKVDVDGVIRNMFDNMCKVYNNCFNEHMTVEDIFDYDVDFVDSDLKTKYATYIQNQIAAYQQQAKNQQ